MERDRDHEMPAKTDSEVTSVSSSARSPRRLSYYVQSPSHDGEKTATVSVHSTPVLSPTASPPHSRSHSRQSSATRFSSSRKISLNDAASASREPSTARHGDPLRLVIEEEGLLHDDYHSHHHKPLPRRCYVLAFLLAFFSLFSIFSLILWGASRAQKPQISINRIRFETFVIQAGTDPTGVPTDMISINSTLKLTFRNRGTFFGVHVTSTPLHLSYSQLTIATGNMKKFYQSRKSQRAVNVAVMGNKIPLYGGGSSWSSPTGKANVPVPLSLNFTVRSGAYVLGKLVKTRFYIKAGCSLVFNPTKLNKPVSLKNSCQYQ